MTRREPCFERRALRGEALFEALIAMVLIASMLLGIAYATARTLKEQRFVKTQAVALSQMRGQLTTQSNLSTLCGAAEPVVVSGVGRGATSYSVPVSMGCSFSLLTVSSPQVVGASATLATPVLRSMRMATTGETASSLLGGDGALEFTQ